MAADEKTEREQYLKELARLKSLRSKQNDEKKDKIQRIRKGPPACAKNRI